MFDAESTEEKYAISYRGRRAICTQKNYERACEALFAKCGLPKGDHPVIERYEKERAY